MNIFSRIVTSLSKIFGDTHFTASMTEVQVDEALAIIADKSLFVSMAKFTEQALAHENQISALTAQIQVLTEQNKQIGSSTELLELQEGMKKMQSNIELVRKENEVLKAETIKELNELKRTNPNAFKSALDLDTFTTKQASSKNQVKVFSGDFLDSHLNRTFKN